MYVEKDWKQKNSPRLSIHPFVCFSASCPFCPRGHWLTLCISRCNKTYCTHRIDSEVIADLRFSASKISRLPPKILVPATLVPLPQFRDVICVALLMQRTCNTHATHMQHDMQHEPFPWKFPGKVPTGMKIYIFHSKTGVELETSNPARWRVCWKKLETKKLCPTTFVPLPPVQGCDLCGPAHATHMQHTCNTHATHMQHDMQHEHFPCKFTVNVQDLTFPAQPQS